MTYGAQYDFAIPPSPIAAESDGEVVVAFSIAAPLERLRVVNVSLERESAQGFLIRGFSIRRKQDEIWTLMFKRPVSAMLFHEGESLRVFKFSDFTLEKVPVLEDGDTFILHAHNATDGEIGLKGAISTSDRVAVNSH